MVDFTDLTKALDNLVVEGHAAFFWLRDDDAVSDTPKLQRLAVWANMADATILLSVIPANADESLARAVARSPHLVPCVHGWAHKNHAPVGEKKMELGTHRPLVKVTAELEAGLERIFELFGDLALPVLVPPWNRISDDVVKALPKLGLLGLSIYADEFVSIEGAQVKVMNTHVDVIDWRGRRGCRTHADLVGDLIAEVNKRARFGEPIGVLTHHLVHDDQVWEFLEEFAAFVHNHPAANWVSPKKIFPKPNSAKLPTPNFC